MKKALVLVPFLFIAFVCFAGGGRNLQTISDSSDFKCPEDCLEGSSAKCCATSGGSVYYGKCKC